MKSGIPNFRKLRDWAAHPGQKSVQERRKAKSNLGIETLQISFAGSKQVVRYSFEVDDELFSISLSSETLEVVNTAISMIFDAFREATDD